MKLICAALGIVFTVAALTMPEGVAATTGKLGYHKRPTTPATVPAGISAADWLSLQQQVPPIAQQAYLKASNTRGQFDTVSGENFGLSVATSGETVVVGAPFESSDAIGVNGDGNNINAPVSGAAYVFVRQGTHWIQQAFLKASDTVHYDAFGYSVAISGDTAVVGAVKDSTGSAGGAYIFVRHGTNWSQEAYLKASNPDANDSFGQSVALSGNTLVIGAWGESSNATGVNGDQSDNSAEKAGAAYVFVRSGKSWSQQAYLKASNTEEWKAFGMKVGLSGDTAVIGPGGYVFVRHGTKWSQQAYLEEAISELNHGISWSVAVERDTVVLGSAGDLNSSGAAYVFLRSGTNWTQQARLRASNPDGAIFDEALGDRFGESVTVSGDTIVVGAPNEASNAIGVNGDQTNNQAPMSGAAYVFSRNGTNWIQQAYLKASNTGGGFRDYVQGDFFGSSVAVSGRTVVIGAIREDSNATGVDGDGSDNSATNSGAAYIFANLVIPPDSDGDGVTDAEDDCPNTPAGAITDASGCSIVQLVPCDGKWRNHGEYFLSLLKVTTHFHKAGLITKTQWRTILREGLRSDCGKRRKK